MRTKNTGDEAMSVKKMATYLGAAAVALALGALVASTAALAETKLETRLTSNVGDASGKAKFELRGNSCMANDDRCRLSIQVEDAGIDPAAVGNLTADVEACGSPIATGLAVVDGAVVAFEIDLDTRDGDSPPLCSKNAYNSVTVEINDDGMGVTNPVETLTGTLIAK